MMKWKLSDREKEVLYYLTLGLTNSEIAKILFVSSHTVKAHVASIYLKTQISSRVSLAVNAYKNGILKDFNE